MHGISLLWEESHANLLWGESRANLLWGKYALGRRRNYQKRRECSKFSAKWEKFWKN